MNVAYFWQTAWTIVVMTLSASALDAQEAERIKSAVSKSIALLQSCDRTFFNNTGCLACHHQSVTAIAVAEARKHGVPLDEDAADEQRKLIGVVLKMSRSRKLQRLESPFAQPTTVGYYALAFRAQGYEADENTDALVMDMAGRQTAEGYWTAFGHRPPIEFSSITSTAFAIKAMQLYGPPTRRREFAGRTEKARKWLVQSEPFGNEEQVFRLLGLTWARADQAHVNVQYASLEALQRKDGGWAQLPHLKTDAYATAMALFALGESGMPPEHSTYRKGVEFLLQTQESDGSWFVKSRSEPVQTYFESGFPHGPDQWISAAATGWASIVLLKTLN